MRVELRGAVDDERLKAFVPEDAAENQPAIAERHAIGTPLPLVTTSSL